VTPFGILVGGQCAVIGVAVATSPAEPSPEGTFGPTFWATIGLIVTTVLGFVFQAYREARDRRWKREDAEAKAQIATLAEEHEKAAEQGRKLIVEKIDENTQMNAEAIKVANNLNEKVAAAHETAAAALAAVQQQTPHTP
jgi:ADP-ribosylglycohydrolase